MAKKRPTIPFIFDCPCCGEHFTLGIALHAIIPANVGEQETKELISKVIESIEYAEISAAYKKWQKKMA